MRVPILCYHKVGLEAVEGRNLNIEPRRLDSHIRYFKRRRFRFLRCGELREWPNSPAVCFTFDDAYLSTVENAVPVFGRHEVPMTLFAVSKLVGEQSSWDAEKARPLADWDALIACQKAGHEIGNHTANHPRLSQLDLEAQRREVELCDSELRHHGLHPHSFCFPYGSLNDQSLSALEGAGYPIGLALGKRLATSLDDKRKLPRIVIAFSDGLPMLIYKLKVKPLLRRDGGPS